MLGNLKLDIFLETLMSWNLHTRVSNPHITPPSITCSQTMKQMLVLYFLIFYRILFITGKVQVGLIIKANHITYHLATLPIWPPTSLSIKQSTLLFSKVMAIAIPDVRDIQILLIFIAELYGELLASIQHVLSSLIHFELCMVWF